MAENNNNLMNNLEEVKETVEAGAKQVVEFAKDAKEKYDQAAPETQEKIKKGVVKGAAVLAALVCLKKIFGRKK